MARHRLFTFLIALGAFIVSYTLKHTAPVGEGVPITHEHYTVKLSALPDGDFGEKIKSTFLKLSIDKEAEQFLALSA